MNRQTIDPIEGALIAAGRIEEQLEEVTALIHGAIALLPEGAADTILHIASDYSGDTGNLASLRRCIEALKEGRP
ncbi:hypothetical protein [Castellaniella sp.]|uniref:hypothetical protein n=1 Tax=Castellaniella sp. TaxID=1955812 RepID=UPI003A9471D9